MVVRVRLKPMMICCYGLMLNQAVAAVTVAVAVIAVIAALEKCL